MRHYHGTVDHRWLHIGASRSFVLVAILLLGSGLKELRGQTTYVFETDGFGVIAKMQAAPSNVGLGILSLRLLNPDDATFEVALDMFRTVDGLEYDALGIGGDLSIRILPHEISPALEDYANTGKLGIWSEVREGLPHVVMHFSDHPRPDSLLWGSDPAKLTGNWRTAVIPEPSGIQLLALGLVFGATQRRREAS